MARVVISRSPEKILALAKLVFKKHQADGAASPLNTLKDFTWADHGAKVEQADVINAEAKKLEKEVEKLYQKRDALLAPVEKTLRASAKLLSGAYTNSPKTLGDWGFEVNDTVSKKKDTSKP